jgi:hypothetical protein
MPEVNGLVNKYTFKSAALEKCRRFCRAFSKKDSAIPNAVVVERHFE